MQDSPLQSGHSHVSQVHDAFATFLAEQQEPSAATVAAGAVAAPQPQPLHSQTSHVHDSPLQSGHLQFSQPQVVLLTDSLPAVAKMVDTSTRPNPTTRTAKTYFISVSFVTSETATEDTGARKYRLYLPSAITNLTILRPLRYGKDGVPLLGNAQ